MVILEMSLATIGLIVVIIVLRSILLNKIPKRTFVVLWGIVALRLLMPFSLQSRLSIHSLAAIIFRSHVNVKSLSDINDTMLVNMTIKEMPFILLVVKAIWATGMLTLVVIGLIIHLKWRRIYSMALPIENVAVERWKKSHKLKRGLSVKQSDRVTIPLTYGIFHPVIILPKTLDYTDEEKLFYILEHEYTHVKSFDVLLKYVLAICVSIHWFNPSVWMMYMLANRDIEMSCDENVVRKFGLNTKTSYAKALVNLEETKNVLVPLSSNFNRNGIEERIYAIMKVKKPTYFIIVFSVLLVCGVFIIFGTTPSKAEENVNMGKSNNEINNVYTWNEDIPSINSSPEIPTIVMTSSLVDESYSAYAVDKDGNIVFQEDGITKGVEEAIEYISGKIFKWD